jgi:amidase
MTDKIRGQSLCKVKESGAFIRVMTIEPKGSGPLNGLSFAVKDLMDVAGLKTGCGNPTWLKTHPAAAANAVCVDQLLFAGARCVGKTFTDELAFGLDGENAHYGTPLNPRAPDRVPGGSSSGSASAVACGIVDFALGTDTGGSVRVPASNCGIFGLRPSHGLISVAGVNPLAPSFDTVGILARSCDVLAAVASVLLGRDIPATAAVERVYLLKDAFEITDEDVREALAAPVERISNHFQAKTRTVSLRDLEEDPAELDLRGWYETYCRIQWAEIWSCHGAWVEDAKPEWGPRPGMNFRLVKEFDRSVVPEAVRRREAYHNLLQRLLGPRDLLCIPTTPTPAPVKGTLGIDRRVDTYFSRTLSLTAIAGIGRLPQVTLPVAAVQGAPIGVSLLASQGNDAFLLAAARSVM